jgi:hypothetical protein
MCDVKELKKEQELVKFFANLSKAVFKETLIEGMNTRGAKVPHGQVDACM